MDKLLRTLFLGLMAGAGLGAAAQGHTLYVAGHMTPCNPALVGTAVNIQVHGYSGLTTLFQASLNENCSYSAQLLVPDTAGSIAVISSCGNGLAAADSAFYSFTPPFTTDVILNLTCPPENGYEVHVGGLVSPCDLLDNTVTVRCTSCSPWVEEVVPVNANCGYSAVLNVPNMNGTIVVAAGCSNGLVPNNTIQYIVNPGQTGTQVTLNLSCAPLPAEACFTVEQTAPFTAQFANCSTGCLAPYDFLWDFSGPNGGTASGDVVSHTFPGPGTYAVCLNFTGADGCQGHSCQQVQVNTNGGINTGSGWTDCLGVVNGADTTGAPCQQGGIIGIWNNSCECAEVSSCQACYTMDQTAPFSAVFNGSCSSSTPGTLTYLWDISGPNGGGSTGELLDHTFPDPGVYSVCLNISSSAGCADATCRQVYVGPNGDISFTPPNNCSACIEIEQTFGNGSLVPFSVNLLSCANGVAPLLIEWELPNGTWSSQPNPTYQVNGPGSYTFCQVMTGADGCSRDTCSTVVFNVDGFISTDPVVFDCLQVPNGPNMPGTACVNPATGINGTWDANCTCVPTSTDECEADFWAIQAYENGDTIGVPLPNTLWVWNLSSGGTGQYQFLWNFGDGSSSTLDFPTHTYNADGPYLLCLSLTDSEGCTDTHCDSISVDENGLINGMIVEGHGIHTVPGTRSAGFTINVMDPLAMAVPEMHFADVKTWPNPAQERLEVSFRSTVSGQVNTEVLDATGRRIMATTNTLMTGQNNLQLDVTSLPAGLYLLRIGDGAQGSALRFVKAD